jgi:hypothetical protein
MDRDVVGTQGDLRGGFKGDMFWSKIVVLFFAAKKKKKKKSFVQSKLHPLQHFILITTTFRSNYYCHFPTQQSIYSISFKLSPKSKTYCWFRNFDNFFCFSFFIMPDSISSICCTSHHMVIKWRKIRFSNAV